MTEQEYSEAFKDLWPLFALSCGIAFLCGRRKVKESYKGRTKLSAFVNDVVTAVSTAVLAVSASVVLSLVWPDLADIKMQICAVGLMSGYGMNFINRLIERKLGLSTTDLNDPADVAEARRHRNRKNKKKGDGDGEDQGVPKEEGGDGVSEGKGRS